MNEYQAPLKDMQFVIHEVFNAAEQWHRWPQTRERVDRETADAILEEAARLASREIAPINRPGDETGCQWHDGTVTTPPGYQGAYRCFADGGWIGLSGDPQYGGMGMPKVLSVQLDEMLCSASLAFSLYPSLSFGVTLALQAHGSQELKSLYLPRLYSGEWAGTMCLTEPQAGTDLGLITTRACANSDGSYSLSGTKIFISGGDHDLTENIIHLVLARLPDAPDGTRGISMFLVPKKQVAADGTLIGDNGVSCGALEQKMGLKASATCVMNFDQATGYLVGEPNKGLAAMFTMMNHERLLVGIQGIGCGEMSYQNALAYAKERLQGRSATGTLHKDKPADPILVHGDIRRMLLNMKALNEAARALSTYIALQLDCMQFSDNPEERARADSRVALLTPVAKAFLTDMGLDNCISGQQILGGHGYIREWGQEQLVRDVRIAQIYEGTNGIQALDLLGRKIARDNGHTFRALTGEIRISLNSSQLPDLVEPLEQALDRLEALTDTLLAQARSNPNTLSGASVDYLHALAYVIHGWMWLQMAETATQALATGSDDSAYYQGKLTTARYYVKRLLPRCHALADAAQSGAEILYALDDSQF